MKQKVLFAALIFGLSALAWTQTWGPGRNPPNNPRPPIVETVTVSGSLVVAHGFPALKSGDATYIIRGINRLTGFIDGLKEGAEVTVEGNAVKNPRDNKLMVLQPIKLTLNGKSYDMALPSPFLDLRQHEGAPRPHEPRAPGRQAPPPPHGRQRGNLL